MFGALDGVGVQTSPTLGKRADPLTRGNTPWYGIKTEEEQLCMLGDVSHQSSHIACGI